MKFKNIGIRKHFLTESETVEPGAIIETNVDLAAAFPDKFLRVDNLAEAPAAKNDPETREIAQEAPQPAADPGPKPDAQEKAAPRRRTRRASK
jgi:hypothetical protein